MTTQLPVRIASILLFLALVAGCKNDSKKSKENPIAFDSIQVDRTYHLLANDSNPNCNLQIKFIYPVKYKDPEILKKVRQIFVETYFGDESASLSPEEAVKKYTEEYIGAYKDLEPDYAEDREKAKASDEQVGAWYSYYETSGNEIAFNRSDILSFSIFQENYTGGAHGAHACNNHVVNLKTGKLVTERDIFVDDYQDTLAALLVGKIAGENGVKDPKELENAGFFSVDEIYPNGNFLVDDAGITYTFNEYEIAAYVVGQTHVFLSYPELQMILRKDSPISHLFEK